MRADLLAADTRARERAIECFDSHLILEAGAGTGKTTVLVSRFVAWCLGAGFEEAAYQGGAPGPRVFESVAALTFSEAAAAEMETRIAIALREVAEGRTPRGVPEGFLATQGDADARARELLDHCERLQVSTIHAFCRRVLSAFPVEAGVAPRFRIDASGRAAGRAAREAIERVLSAPTPEEAADLEALAELGCGPAELEGMLAGLLLCPLEAKDFAADPLSTEALTRWWARIREALRPLCKAGDATAQWTEAWLGAASPTDTSALDQRLHALRARWPDALCKRLGRTPNTAPALPILQHLRSLDAAVLGRIHRLLVPQFAEASRQLDVDGVQSFDGLLRRTRDLLRNEPRVRAQLRGSLRQLFVDEFQDTDALQCEIVASLALGDSGPTLFVVGDPKQSIYGWRSADLRSYDAFLARLRDAGAEQHQLSVSHRSFPEILEEVEAVLGTQMVREEGVQPAFQPLVASDAQQLRAKSMDCAERVAYWIAQPIDEGGVARPTSSAESLALETRALVDDLWRTRRERGLPWREIAILLRSTGELDDYLDALRRAGIPYAVDRDRVYFRRREVLEARALLRVVLDPNDDLAWVATLRSARFGVPDAAWLPLQQAGGIDCARRALCGEASALGEMSKTFDAVAREIEGAAVPRLDVLHSAGWQHAAQDGVATLVALRNYFEHESFELFLARARRSALFDVSEGSRFLGRYRLANLDRFFREIGELYERSGADEAAVLRELRREDVPLPESEEGRPPTAGTDAVQVMTIHGAKGLDFEQVYLLQVHKGSAIRNDEAVATGWQDPGVEFRLRWGRRREEVTATLNWDRVEERRRATERAEQIRTLYVAMTRAKTRLVVSGQIATGRAGAGRSHADSLAPRIEDPLPAGVSKRILGASAEVQELAESRRSPATRGSSIPRAFLPQREAAAVYAARPYGLAASAAVSTAARAHEANAAGAALTQNSGSERGAAVGTAIHAFLEFFDFSETGNRDPWGGAAAHAALRARLANRVDGAERDDAERDALAVLDRFRESALWPRLREIQPHVLGREVPLLSGAGAETGAVGFHIGAIDLLHRDPDTGDVVVVDFKSDRIADDAALDKRAAHYAPQGAVYCDAVADAMELQTPPRFELWFLAAGRRVVVDVAASARVRESSADAAS